MQPTTPRTISPEIRNFISTFSAEEPVYVDVSETMVPLECFRNSRQYVEANGGKVVLGWIIWEAEGVFVEAEHHGLVERPDGTLLDVTPHDGEPQVLFVRDPDAAYNGKAGLPSRRQALVDDPELIEYLKLNDRKNVIDRRIKMYGFEKLTGAYLRDMKLIRERWPTITASLSAKYSS